MRLIFSAPLAELLQFQRIRVLLFVFVGAVVDALALRAREFNLMVFVGHFLLLFRPDAVIRIKYITC